MPPTSHIEPHTSYNDVQWVKINSEETLALQVCGNTVKSTDYGHQERAFFQTLETFGLGQTNWAEILGGILAISSQTIGTIMAL